MIELTLLHPLAGSDTHLAPITVNPDNIIWVRPMAGHPAMGVGSDILLAPPMGRLEVAESYETVRAILAEPPLGHAPVQPAGEAPAQDPDFVTVSVTLPRETAESIVSPTARLVNTGMVPLRDALLEAMPVRTLGRAPGGTICFSETPDPFHDAEWAFDNPDGGRLFCCDEHIPDGWVKPGPVTPAQDPPGTIDWTVPGSQLATGHIDDLPAGWYWRFAGGMPGERDEYCGPFPSPYAAATSDLGPDDPSVFDSIICHEPPPRLGEPPYMHSDHG